MVDIWGWAYTFLYPIVDHLAHCAYSFPYYFTMGVAPCFAQTWSLESYEPYFPLCSIVFIISLHIQGRWNSASI